jgi:hypothetical protein
MAMLENLDRERELQNELEQDERVLWTGGPAPGRMAMQCIPIVLFGVPWTAFALFWMAMAGFGVSQSHESGPFFLFPLFGLPFVLIGIGMLTSPLWASRSAGRTTYAVTDRRAIIVTGGRWRTVKSYWPRDIREIERRQRPDGSGDLLFAWEPYSGSRSSRPARPGFYGIPNVQVVEGLLTDALEKHGGGAAPR